MCVYQCVCVCVSVCVYVQELHTRLTHLIAHPCTKHLLGKGLENYSEVMMRFSQVYREADGRPQLSAFRHAGRDLR